MNSVRHKCYHFQSPFFSVAEEVITSDKGKFNRFTVEHPGAVVIFPLSSGGKSVLLLRQYRHALREWILEIPAGTLAPGEAPLDCAKREIQEETGFAASEWTQLGTLYPSPGFCNEVQHLFAASNLHASRLDADEDEQIEVVEVSLSELDQLVTRGEIRDAKTLASILLVKMAGLIPL